MPFDRWQIQNRQLRFETRNNFSEVASNDGYCPDGEREATGLFT